MMRRWTGWAAVLVFVVMALLLQMLVAPATGGVLLQAQVGVSERALAEFALGLAQAGRMETYGWIVGGLDSVFILCFSVWVAVSLGGLWGILSGLAFACLDLTENALILMSGWMRMLAAAPQVEVILPAQGAGWALVAYVTLAKLAMFLCLVILVFSKNWMVGRKQA